MLKRIKSFFKKSPVKNQAGSVMSVALIVITILTFSITTITNVSVNLAGATSVKLEQVNDENYAKGMLRQAISELEESIETNGNFDEFTALALHFETDFLVFATDVTDDINYDPDDNFGTVGEHESRMYRFAFELVDGEFLVKYAYVSNGGTATENLNPFDFSLSTNGTLVMNGGYYDEINLYGNDVLLSGISPYLTQFLLVSIQDITPYSSDNGSTFPVLTPGLVESVVYATDEYRYCDPLSSCFDTNLLGNPFVINNETVDIYVDVEGSALPDQGELAEDSISDFFGGFDYEDYTVIYLQEDAPTDSREITAPMTLATAAAVVYANSAEIEYKPNGQPKKPIPTTPFIDITNDSNWDFSQAENFKDWSAYWDGDLTISYNVKFKETDSLFINGDLTIDNTGGTTLDLEGTFIITGDLYITGNSVDIEGTFFVFGETYVNFDDDEGIITQGNNDGFSLLAQDNIIFEAMYVSHVNATAPTRFSAFFFTEESIYIDAVNGKFHMEGALFARAQGVSGNQIFMDDESGTQINGIVINSYRGYINTFGNAVPTTADSTNRFNISIILQDNFQSKFRNIPVFDTLISNIDNWTFETSEWYLE